LDRAELVSIDRMNRGSPTFRAFNRSCADRSSEIVLDLEFLDRGGAG
jgi:hypothetical protein